MQCRFCGCFVESKTDWKITIALICLAILLGFAWGQVTFYLHVRPLFIEKIEKDGEIKKELQKGYLPPKADPKSKQGAIK